MRLTSLPAETTPAERLVAFYRPRRQVELAFKRLKTLGGPDDLPASDPDPARTWLLAQPIGAVLAEDIATSMAAIPSLGRGPGGRRRQCPSPWRAWKIARGRLRDAILPRRPDPPRSGHTACRAAICEPPRRRPSRAANISSE